MKRTCTCRGCGAEIIFIRTPGGKSIPCDAREIPFRLARHGDEGTKALVKPDGKITWGVFDPASESYGYISHFATCPAADMFRRRGR